VALAQELPAATIYATDISSAALKVAARNAIRHNFLDRIHLIESNLLGSFANAVPRPGHEPVRLDLIVSNPPYIGRREAPTLAREVRDHEPHEALFGGEEGYELYGELISQSASLLQAGGILVLELGHDSLPAVRPLLDAAEWTNVGVTNDLAGIPRVIAAERT
jgi:release factor glutamine methyltransferase